MIVIGRHHRLLIASHAVLVCEMESGKVTKNAKFSSYCQCGDTKLVQSESYCIVSGQDSKKWA